MLWCANQPPLEDIRIGICADLDMPNGKETWQGVTLAAEQINAEGGILGRNLTVIAEDDDSETPPGDISVASNALIKLITVDKADYIIWLGSANNLPYIYQDICAEHKKILLSLASPWDNVTQRVLDNYEKYKYFFTTITNDTATVGNMVDSLVTLRDYSGFNKVAYIDQDASTFAGYRAIFNKALAERGFELVYQGSTGWLTTDFTSYVAAIEASGAEILFPVIVSLASYSFLKEWYDSQAPFVIWGMVMHTRDVWELTEGKCEYVSVPVTAAQAGFPFTNETLPAREAYINRWGEVPGVTAFSGYDALRFILSDAIRRAGTTETEAVIKALETTCVETTSLRPFAFSSSHGFLTGLASQTGDVEDVTGYGLVFQWQNGIQVPVYPESIMEESGATYRYPPWQGPWSNSQTP